MSTSELDPHRGGLILALGILGILVCFPLSIMAWVMGNGDMAQIRAGHMDPTGEGLTNAGRIIGIVGTILAAVGILIAILFIVIGIGAAASQA